MTLRVASSIKTNTKIKRKNTSQLVESRRTRSSGA
jgi:hypothetical protein